MRFAGGNMNSIERVKAAVQFKGPDRVPVYKAGLGDVLPMCMLPSKNWSPGFDEHERGLFPYHYDDTYVKLRMWRWKKPDWARASEYRDWLKLPREEVDEFGAIWIREGENRSLGHPGRPVLADWADYDSYVGRYAPDAADRTRYSDFLRISKLVGRNRYRMCLLGWQGPLTSAHSIRGFTNWLADHRRHPEELKALLAHLTSFYIASMKCWVQYGARPHGFLLVDDLGDQQRPFMRPAMFADFYEPVFRPIIETAHELGCEIFMHSCGKIDMLMPLFLDWGLDAFEFDAPRMIGYEDLEPFRGKIMMWGCVDIQKIYATGTPEECEREVAVMMKSMGTARGGFGAYFYATPWHIGVPKENIEAFKRGLKTYGDYTRLSTAWWNDGDLASEGR